MEMRDAAASNFLLAAASIKAVDDRPHKQYEHDTKAMQACRHC